MSDPKPELKRECPHCHGSLERYEDPVAVKLLDDRDREIERLQKHCEQLAHWKIAFELVSENKALVIAEADSLRAQLEASEANCKDWAETFQQLAHKCTNTTQQLEASQKACAEMRETIEKNHKWHQEYDDYGGYAESDLCELNCHAASISIGANYIPRERLSDAIEHCRKLCSRVDALLYHGIATIDGPFDADPDAAARDCEQAKQFLAQNQPHP